MDYITVSGGAEAEFTEKRSRFICAVMPVSEEDEALAFIHAVSKKHFGARHNIYAYSLKNGIKRFSDDGEPQGTAGIPALSVLEQRNIVDCALVVTRYFGGILLGASGLARAYSHAARLGVDAAKTILVRSGTVALITCEYNHFNKIEQLIHHADGKILHSNFSEKVLVECVIPDNFFSDFCAKTIEISGGTYSPEKIGEKFF